MKPRPPSEKRSDCNVSMHRFPPAYMASLFSQATPRPCSAKSIGPLEKLEQKMAFCSRRLARTHTSGDMQRAATSRDAHSSRQNVPTVLKPERDTSHRRHWMRRLPEVRVVPNNTRKRHRRPRMARTYEALRQWPWLWQEMEQRPTAWQTN